MSQSVRPNILGSWKIDAAALASVVGIGLLVGLLQVRPAIATHEAHARMLAMLNAERQKLADRRHAVAGVRGQIEQVERFIRDNHLELQGGDQLNHRLTRLSELTAARGLQLDAIEPGKSTAGSQYDLVPIKLSGQGGYRDVTRFLSDLRKELPDTGVTGFDLIGAAGGGQGPGRFTLQLIWFSASAGAATPAAPGTPVTPPLPAAQASVPE